MTIRRISHRQLFGQQLVLGQLGIYLVTVPVTSYLNGRQGVPSLLLMGVLFLAASIFFIRMKPCYANPERYMGKYAGKIFCLLHLSYLFITGVLPAAGDQQNHRPFFLLRAANPL